MAEVMTREQADSVAPEVKVPPAAPADPVLGNLRSMQRDPLRFMLSLMRRYGDVVTYHFFRRPGYLVTSADGIKQVLQENNRNYSKDLYDYRVLKIVLGNGLLTNDGESWLSQRRLMQPAFHRQRIAGFGAIMTESAEQMVARRWRAVAASGRPVDVAAEMQRLTLRIAGLTLFSQDLTEASGELGQAITVAQRRLSEQFFRPYLPMWVPTPGHQALKAALATMDRLVFAMIAERRADGVDRGDLLSMLLAARDEETGEGMNDQQLRDEVLTLLLAGHETTANALTWTWYLLSQHPDVWRKLRAELDEVLAGRTPTAQDLPALPYARMVIDESMRLYPPAWVMSRLAVGDDEIAGYHIPGGSVVLLSPYVTHRNPRYWENPEGFDPERFSKERSRNRPPFAYFPFGGGPRLCIGQSFAQTEAVLILATVAQHIRPDLVSGHPIALEPLITLRSRYGMRMTLHAV